ncbi:hypothetical protein CBR_g3510 [Chara braunii]|uniref:CDP-diacylglycerol--inositol 3-phosphatidyltransferase n=1 Tax=Chara braunii TaxID=69332 RepID=A0A388KFN1_CHABU|nr:hypothetical protein CBR_g3510 [Chara braunii]|eukprot:GBG68816.1 hypothetical protein CBR_g3510 [Chara braunii]
MAARALSYWGNKLLCPSLAGDRSPKISPRAGEGGLRWKSVLPSCECHVAKGEDPSEKMPSWRQWKNGCYLGSTGWRPVRVAMARRAGYVVMMATTKHNPPRTGGVVPSSGWATSRAGTNARAPSRKLGGGAARAKTRFPERTDSPLAFGGTFGGSSPPPPPPRFQEPTDRRRVRRATMRSLAVGGGRKGLRAGGFGADPGALSWQRSSSRRHTLFSTDRGAAHGLLLVPRRLCRCARDDPTMPKIDGCARFPASDVGVDVNKNSTSNSAATAAAATMNNRSSSLPSSALSAGVAPSPSISEKLRVFFLVPNLVDYVRVLLAVVMFAVGPENHPRSFVLLYIVCFILDAVDGSIARALHQESGYGAFLDVAIDCTLRSMMWAAALKGPLGAVVPCIEWCVFVGTHARGGAAWKTGCFVGAPWWVRAAIYNGFRSLAGALVIAGLHFLPLWIWIYRWTSLHFLRSISFGIVLAIGRVYCLAVELWTLSRHVGSIIESDCIQRQGDVRDKKQ